MGLFLNQFPPLIFKALIFEKSDKTFWRKLMKKVLFLSCALSAFCFNAEARSLGTDYSMFKYWLNKNYGIDYGIDASVLYIFITIN